MAAKLQKARIAGKTPFGTIKKIVLLLLLLLRNFFNAILNDILLSVWNECKIAWLYLALSWAVLCCAALCDGHTSNSAGARSRTKAITKKNILYNNNNNKYTMT